MEEIIYLVYTTDQKDGHLIKTTLVISFVIYMHPKLKMYKNQSKKYYENIILAQ